MSDSRPAQHSNGERRKWPRVPGSTVRAFLLPSVYSYHWPVTVHDIAPGGLSLFLPHPITVEPGAVIKLYNRATSLWLKLEIRVVEPATYVHDRIFLRAAFVRELTAEEVQCLL